MSFSPFVEDNCRVRSHTALVKWQRQNVLALTFNVVIKYIQATGKGHMSVSYPWLQKEFCLTSTRALFKTHWSKEYWLSTSFIPIYKLRLCFFKWPPLEFLHYSNIEGDIKVCLGRWSYCAEKEATVFEADRQGCKCLFLHTFIEV